MASIILKRRVLQLASFVTDSLLIKLYFVLNSSYYIFFWSLISKLMVVSTVKCWTNILFIINIQFLCLVIPDLIHLFTNYKSSSPDNICSFSYHFVSMFTMKDTFNTVKFLKYEKMLFSNWSACLWEWWA